MSEFFEFYHCTRAITVARIILSGDGLKKGDVATSSSSGFNAVWLSTDPDPSHYVLKNWPVVEQEKRGAMITVRIPRDSPNLRKWNDVAKAYKIKEGFLKRYNWASGDRPELHWLYRGKIEIDSFVSVDMRQPDGTYRSFTADQTNQGWNNEPWGDLMTYCGEAGLSVMTLFMESTPEPETGWPNRKVVFRKCSYPHCTVDPKVPAELDCSHCYSAQYHGKTCQKQHWKEHKVLCRADPYASSMRFYSVEDKKKKAKK